MERVQPPTLNEIHAAATRLADVILRTPMIPLFSPDAAPDIHLKLETFQPIGSFKLRGVYHAAAQLDDADRARGLSTVSAGNTAQALAWTARRFGVPSRSVMPDHAPTTKIDAVRALGGEPILIPVDQVFQYLREHGWNDEPWSFIHPWTNRDVMIGHGTMAIEIINQCPDVETIFIPVGGGGLLGGVGTGLRLLKPDIRIIAVEPQGCPSLHASIAAGEPRSVECNTICDGVAVPYITDEMFPILRDLTDDVMLISEDDVKATIRLLARSNHVIAEPAGALALAAALAMDHDQRGNTVALVTGGSIDAKKLAAILNE